VVLYHNDDGVISTQNMPLAKGFICPASIRAASPSSASRFAAALAGVLLAGYSTKAWT
jgi:hypothetical protein